MTIAVALMIALILAIIAIFALVDNQKRTEKANEELMIENIQLRTKIGELMVDKSVRLNVAEFLGGKERC